MTKANSTAQSRPRTPEKPAKPRKDFPLFPHSVGQWAKKVRGKLWYFGVWAEPEKAEARWLKECKDLLAGRVPRSRPSDADASDSTSLRDLCNKFLTTKMALRDNGELSPYTWDSYEGVCKELIAEFGKDRLLTDLRPEDFEKLRIKWGKRWGLVRLDAEINRAKVVFNFATKNGMIDKPIFYGEGFNRPNKKTLLLNRAKQGLKMFEAEELRRLIGAATQPMKSMLLLAINTGFGNNDIGQLPTSAVDLGAGWIVYPRPKTGINRRCPLWPETVEALKEWSATRPAPASDADGELFFLTCRGHGWTKGLKNRSITNECRELLNALEIKGARNFYAIRHTFETIGGDSRDQVAVDHIMGHSRNDMASVYRERISDERLQAVAEHVRTWLFAKPAKAGKTKAKGK